MITDRDKLLISHLEKYKFGSIDQLEKLFFKHQKNSYNIVRRRMAEIKNAGYVKAIRDIETNKVIYVYNDGKSRTPSRHRMLVLDVLANLHYQGFNVLEFEVEKFWLNGSVRSDAFTVFTLEKSKARFQFFIEVHLSNNELNLHKYDVLYESKEVQKHLGRDIFPKILLVSDRNTNYYVNNTKVLQLDTKLNEFASIVLP